MERWNGIVEQWNGIVEWWNRPATLYLMIKINTGACAQYHNYSACACIYLLILAYRGASIASFD